jgi:hypothetical protein
MMLSDILYGRNILPADENMGFVAAMISEDA